MVIYKSLGRVSECILFTSNHIFSWLREVPAKGEYINSFCVFSLVGEYITFIILLNNKAVTIVIGFN